MENVSVSPISAARALGLMLADVVTEEDVLDACSRILAQYRSMSSTIKVKRLARALGARAFRVGLALRGLREGTVVRDGLGRLWRLVRVERGRLRWVVLEGISGPGARPASNGEALGG